MVFQNNTYTSGITLQVGLKSAIALPVLYNARGRKLNTQINKNRRANFCQISLCLETKQQNIARDLVNVSARDFQKESTVLTFNPDGEDGHRVVFVEETATVKMRVGELKSRSERVRSQETVGYRRGEMRSNRTNK